MKRKYHLIGIGGIGMSGLAKIALERGDEVSGSDIKSSPIIESLRSLGANIFIGHDASHVLEGYSVVYSTDIQMDNPEIKEAQKRGVPLLHRSVFLKELMKGFFPLLVTGTHGKTTTSSLLTHMLYKLGASPAYSVGGIVQGLQSNGGWGKGKWFVAEADESDRSFLAYDPYGAIITNIGLDHLNHWHSEQNLLNGFFSFYEKVQNKDLFFWCADDVRLSSLKLEGYSYGFSPQADLRIERVNYKGWSSEFSFRWKGNLYEDFKIPMIGNHSVLNASAVVGLCLQLGFEESSIREAIKEFSGVKRRVEKKGEAVGVAVYDDYGHHPTEIASTLEALKNACPDKRVVVAFQPHRFSRTKDCFFQFAPALQKADVVVLTEIYSAGESPIDQVSSEDLFNTLDPKCSHFSLKKDLLQKLLEIVKPGDVVISMGAGDITQIGPQLLERLC